METSVQSYLRRIEKLARQLISVQFDGPQGFWQFELNLLALQREIQEEISRGKSQRQDAEARTRLSDLRYARWHARRLGDTFAWLLLGVEKKAIAPLSNNQRVPIPNDDPGSRGVIAIAEHLSADGWGFPVLHDITDTLRIGDITFVLSETGDHLLRTVEVKTSVHKAADSEDRKNNTETLNVSVHHLLPDSASTPMPEPIRVHSSVGSRDRPGRERVQRQLGRMSTALAHQTAVDGQVFDVDAKPWVSTSIKSNSGDHWKTLRRVIRRARASGYASEAVENSLLYAAFYDSKGVTEELLKNASLPNDLLSSGILIPDRPEENAVVVYGVPIREQSIAATFLPFYLYSIPKKAVFDLLYGRLSIVVIANPGRIREALEAAGFEVSKGTKMNNLAADSLVVSISAVDEHGDSYNFELHNLLYHMQEVIHEFRSVEHLVDVARAMRDTARDAASQVLARETASSDGTTRGGL